MKPALTKFPLQLFITSPMYSTQHVSGLSNAVATSIPSIQLVNRRYHLPSQDEARQSFQLIKQWKSDIAVLKQEISSAEDALRANLTALKSELEAKITALRNEYEAAEKDLENQTRLQTEFSRKWLEDLEKRLDLE
jgi:hypothetical protein